LKLSQSAHAPHRAGVLAKCHRIPKLDLCGIARAAVARSADENDWEHEQLRRNGLGALQLSRDDKALWHNPQTFAEDIAEALREGIGSRFRAQNELDPAFYEHFDRDLRTRTSSHSTALTIVLDRQEL
jgi:hypothetical protein